MKKSRDEARRRRMVWWKWRRRDEEKSALVIGDLHANDPQPDVQWPTSAIVTEQTARGRAARRHEDRRKSIFIIQWTFCWPCLQVQNTQTVQQGFKSKRVSLPSCNQTREEPNLVSFQAHPEHRCSDSHRGHVLESRRVETSLGNSVINSSKNHLQVRAEENNNGE